MTNMFNADASARRKARPCSFLWLAYGVLEAQSMQAYRVTTEEAPLMYNEENLAASWRLAPFRRRRPLAGWRCSVMQEHNPARDSPPLAASTDLS